ncbi:unnamed protein product [Cuscuta epithymum]|uniref:Uncharacterized protein n=1 Tax=Cuscuta epithymum TaxID=186058 RepID=A0AAV0GAW6_9ASTE|nr:unnamed protein product [Cuscuta epithymum]
MGYGCFVDENMGRTVLNPGMESERITVGGSSQMEIDPDAQTKMAIPCERTLRKKIPFKRASEITRNIRFYGDGYDVREPSSLPFQPSGLNWGGNPAITSRQLETQRDIIANEHAGWGDIFHG